MEDCSDEYVLDQFSYGGTYGPFTEAGIDEADVERIVKYMSDSGDCAEEEVWIVAVMKDGRWVHVTGGCDTTGWDCRAGAEAWFASTEDELVRDHLTKESREILGYPPLEV